MTVTLTEGAESLQHSSSLVGVSSLSQAPASMDNSPQDPDVPDAAMETEKEVAELVPEIEEEMEAEQQAESPSKVHLSSPSKEMPSPGPIVAAEGDSMEVSPSEPSVTDDLGEDNVLEPSPGVQDVASDQPEDNMAEDNQEEEEREEEEEDKTELLSVLPDLDFIPSQDQDTSPTVDQDTSPTLDQDTSPTLDQDQETSPTVDQDTSPTLDLDQDTSPTLDQDQDTSPTLDQDQDTSPTVDMDTTPASENSFSGFSSPFGEDKGFKFSPGLSSEGSALLACSPFSTEASPREGSLTPAHSTSTQPPTTTFIPLIPKIGMGKPAISKRKFSPGRPRVKQVRLVFFFLFRVSFSPQILWSLLLQRMLKCLRTASRGLCRSLELESVGTGPFFSLCLSLSVIHTCRLVVIILFLFFLPPLLFFLLLSHID